MQGNLAFPPSDLFLDPELDGLRQLRKETSGLGFKGTIRGSCLVGY